MNGERVQVQGALGKKLLALTIAGLMTSSAIAQSGADQTQGSATDNIKPEFRQLDQNNDSKVEWGDVQAALEPRLTAANLNPKDTFDQYDDNNDNALSEEEFENLISAIHDAEYSAEGTASTAMDTGQVTTGTAYPNDNIGSTTGDLESATGTEGSARGSAVTATGTRGAATSTGTIDTDAGDTTSQSRLGTAGDGAVVSTDQTGTTDMESSADPATDPEAYDELSGSGTETNRARSDSQAEDDLTEQPASYDQTGTRDETGTRAGGLEEDTLNEEPATYEGSSIEDPASSTSLGAAQAREERLNQEDTGGYNDPTLSQNDQYQVQSGIDATTSTEDTGAAGADGSVGVARSTTTTSTDSTVNSAAGGEFTTEQPASYQETRSAQGATGTEQPIEEPIDQSPVAQADVDAPAGLRNMPISTLQEKSVRNANGDKIGDVDELVVNRDNGQIGFVVSSGGVLGIGSKKLLAPVEELSLSGDNLVWDTEKTKGELKDSERYQSDNFVVISDQYETLDDLSRGGVSAR